MNENSSFQEEIVQEDAISQETEYDFPRQYKVIFYNDDYTTMEFVVDVLKGIFHKTYAEAKTLMLQIHNHDKAVVGIYSKEIAETKIKEVEILARENEFPLQVSMEPTENPRTT